MNVRQIFQGSDYATDEVHPRDILTLPLPLL